MLTGVIADVHSNIEALTAVYDKLKQEGCDNVFCLGDVVGYGASPVECIDFIREKRIFCIKGNHDHYINAEISDSKMHDFAREAIMWTRRQLPNSYCQWLKELPYKLDFECLTFVHSSLESADGSSWPYILGTDSALFHFFLQDSRICYYGHTHIPLAFTYGKRKIELEMLKHDKPLASNGAVKYLLNPGSVGQPRDFDSRSSFIIYDHASSTIKTYRVEYDFKKAQKKISDAGLPPMLAQRLSFGI